VPDPVLNKTGSVTYYAESVENSCTSLSRVPVKLTINPAPVQPVSKGDTWECAKNPVQTLNANNNITNLAAGDSLIWFTALTGGTITRSPILSTANSDTTFYASFKNNTTGCRSLHRKAVKLTISSPPPASAASNSPLSVGQTLILKGGPEDIKFTYTWLTPDGGLLTGMDVSIPSVTERSAGYYKLKITDSNGCSSYDSTRVYVNTATIDYLKPVCLGGTLYLTGGPDLPGATYYWTGPDGFTSNDQNPAINYLTLSKTGDYSLKVTDRKGFVTTATVRITVKPLPIAMADSNVPVCSGGTLNLFAGPNGMSSYSWSGPTGPLTGKNPSLTNYSPVAPEKFVLTVIDFNGCEATDTITATIFKPKASSNSPVCQGDTLRLRAIDNGMASYRWSGPNGFTSTRQNPILPGLTTAGTYTLTVTDKSGCVASADPVYVVFNPRPAVPSYTGTGIVVACEANPFVTLDARNEIVPGGAGVTLNWFTASTAGTQVSNPVLDKTGSVTYYAEYFQNSCPSPNRIPVKLTVNPAPVQPVSKGDTWECAKNPGQTLNANDNISNLTGGFSTVWYDALTGGNIVASPVLSVPGDSVTYYAVFKNDTTGCLSLQSTAVKLTISAPGITSAASNSPLSLGSTLILRGGPDLPDLIYTWVAPNGNTFATMDVTIPNITADAAGMYRLTVTGLNGCSSYDSTNVVIAMATADYAKPVCLGGTLYLSGGPDNMASYSWVGPDGFTSFDQNPSINNVTLYKTGAYTLTATDMNGGITTATVNVSFKSPPIAMADANNPVCPGTNLNLLGRPNGMSSYQWEGPNGYASNLQNPVVPNYNPTNPERYLLRIIDLNGCEATDTVITTIFIPKASSNSPVCQGDTLRLRAEPNGMKSYKWTGPNGFQSVFQNPVINKANAALATGVYTLTVTTPSGCSTFVNINISFNPPPPAVLIIPDMNPVCQGSTLTLTGDPSGMASYSWVGPNGFKSTLQNPQIPNITASGAGKYTLTVKTPNGCTSSGSITLSIVKASFTGTYGPFCASDLPVTLSATPAGGLFMGTGVVGNRFDPSAAGVGSHIISYLAPSGLCTVAPITIEVVPSTPVVVTNNTTLANCNGTADLTLPEVTTGSVPGLIFTYWADSGATKRLTNPKAVALGTYYIKGSTLSGNCYSIKPVTVNPSEALQAKFVTVSPACSGSATGSIDVVVTKGIAPYTYQWDTNPVQTTSRISDLVAGIYTVTITDSTMCSITLKDTLRDHPGVKIFFAHKDIQCLSDANGTARVDSITFSGKPSVLNLYTYKWNTTPVQTTREAVHLSYGYHTVTMTDSKGCGIKDSILIDVLDTIPPSIDCRKDTITIVIQANDPASLSPNTVVVDLGKPIVWDNCGVASLTNDAPEKFRVGITRVIWTATDFVGLTDTCSQVVYVKAIPTVPQLFSPNGDGINDYFEIDGLMDFPKSKLYVYTRSGQLVFSSEDYKNEWDGKFQTSQWSHNQFVAPGVYYYILYLGTINRKIQGFVYVYY
jgi:gliding motility-associated-like protein